MVGQGPAVLAAGAGRVGCFWVFFFFVVVVVVVFISSILSSFSNALSLGRRLDIPEILWSRPLFTQR